MKNSFQRKIHGAFVLVVAATLSNGVNAVDNESAKKRNKSVNSIVLHSIGGPFCKNDKVVFSGSSGSAEKWKKYFEKEKDVSIHYIIDRSGNIASSIDEDKIAWHAKGKNARSIGIELTNNGDGQEVYTQDLIDSLSKLVKEIIKRHPDIKPSNIIRHSDIDNRTFKCGGKDEKLKRDPGSEFPFDEFIRGLSQ